MNVILVMLDLIALYLSPTVLLMLSTDLPYGLQYYTYLSYLDFFVISIGGARGAEGNSSEPPSQENILGQNYLLLIYGIC